MRNINEAPPRRRQTPWLSARVAAVAAMLAVAAGAGCRHGGPRGPVGEGGGASVAGQPADASEGSAVPPEAAPALSAGTAPVAGSHAPERTVRASMLLVNGHPLTVEEVLEPILPALRRLAAEASDTDYWEQARRLVAQQAGMAISELLVYDRASQLLNDRVREVLGREADREIRRRVTEEFGGRQTRFEDHLARLGLTLDDVRERILRRMLVAEYLRQELLPRVGEPSRQQMWAYYRSHEEEFHKPQRREMLVIEIPVSSSGGTAGDPPAPARSPQALAREALEALRAGKAFTEVARRYSRGAGAALGGNWGLIARGALAPQYRPLEDALFALEPGGYSDIIELPEGLFIVGVGRVEPAVDVSFEDAQQTIRLRLREQWLRQAEQEYLRRLRDAADIQRLEEFEAELVRALPDPGSLRRVSGDGP